MTKQVVISEYLTENHPIQKLRVTASSVSQKSKMGGDPLNEETINLNETWKDKGSLNN